MPSSIPLSLDAAETLCERPPSFAPASTMPGVAGGNGRLHCAPKIDSQRDGVDILVDVILPKFSHQMIANALGEIPRILTSIADEDTAHG
jgi:hypothetical protein